MEHEFWHERWATNRIAFHKAEPHPLLRRHLGSLGWTAGDTLFLPLCGKTVDIDWLLGEGLDVVGCELNEGAVEAVFARLGLEPEREAFGSLMRLKAGALTIFIGDYFELTSEELGPMAGVFDRGSLVALPKDMRQSYVPHLAKMARGAPHLTIAYDYDQAQTEGPPFSVPLERVQALYAKTHRATLLEARAITGALAEDARARS